VARVYDFFLGGSHNFAVDREFGQRVMETAPLTPGIMRANRAFLRRAVQFCVAAGVRQFIDIGSGIPTVGNVHEIAQRADPGARVVYVDIDSVAVAHSQVILEGNPFATVVQGDARQPEQVLAHPETRRLIDPEQPVAVLLVALLHFLSDDAEVDAILRTVKEMLVPGSYLVISHGSLDGQPPEAREVVQMYSRSAVPLVHRTRAQIEAFFDGLELVEPGVVHVPVWRPDTRDETTEHPERYISYGGVGRKP
jgi:O-methyltransferase involved in polyketide biosynthesis